MKKFVSVVLAIIMVGLVVLLCINISIKSMAAKTVANAVVANETTDQIQQVITEIFLTLQMIRFNRFKKLFLLAVL